jgi:hypothetical protein
MSRRISDHWGRGTFTLAWGIAVLLVSLLAAQPAQMLIDSGEGGPGDTAWVLVDLVTASSPVSAGGADLLIGYDGNVLSLLDATPGPSLNMCDWEYFTYRTDVNVHCTGVPDPSCPSHLLRIVAIADVNNGNTHPSCYLQNWGGTFASLRFLILPGTPFPSQSLVRFYWADCGDNIVSSATGDTLYFAHQVFDFNSQTPFPTPASLPGIAGVPDSCVNSPGKTSLRQVDFLDGIVYVYPLNIKRGDLNLNGLAYEVSDLIVYQNFFFFGPVSLDPDPQRRNQQIAASDINADDQMLTFRDLTYLYRIIIGDAIPFPKAGNRSVTVAFTQDRTNSSISVNCPNNLAAVLLHFHGKIVPEFKWPYSQFTKTSYDTLTNETSVAVYCPTSSSSCGDTIFYYGGNGTLQNAAAGDWLDSDISSSVTVTGTANDCGDFNGSGNIDISDAVYFVIYVFAGGAAPVDSHHGDVNCDGSSDISDVVYLMQYIFAGGPAPCTGC